MEVSENRGPQYSTLNSKILIIRTPQNKVLPIFGNSHIGSPKPGNPSLVMKATVQKSPKLGFGVPYFNTFFLKEPL